MDAVTDLLARLNTHSSNTADQTRAEEKFAI